MSDPGAKKSRLISKSCEITVNLGDMQFMKLRGSVEERVEYSTDGELRESDDKMWHDLGNDLKRGLFIALADLGKTTEADMQFIKLCKEKSTPKKTDATQTK